MRILYLLLILLVAFAAACDEGDKSEEPVKEAEMATVSALIANVLRNMDSDKVLDEVREKVRELTSRFPVS